MGHSVRRGPAAAVFVVRPWMDSHNLYLKSFLWFLMESVGSISPLGIFYGRLRNAEGQLLASAVCQRCRPCLCRAPTLRLRLLLLPTLLKEQFVGKPLNFTRKRFVEPEVTTPQSGITLTSHSVKS